MARKVITMARKGREYVRLNEKAASFYDVTSGLQLANKQVKKLTAEQYQSKRVQKALKGGHLEYADVEDFEEYLETLATEDQATEDQAKAKGKTKAKGKEDEEEEEEEEDDFDPTQSTVKELKAKYTEKEMVALILENNEELGKGDLPKGKDNLAEIILNDYELEDEEEEDEEEDED